jgi:hypothetical protein
MGRPLPLADHPTRPARCSALPSSAYYKRDFRVYLDVSSPGLGHAFRDDPHNLTVIAPDSSHAHITPDTMVTEAGGRRMGRDRTGTPRMGRAREPRPRELPPRRNATAAEGDLDRW